MSYICHGLKLPLASILDASYSGKYTHLYFKINNYTVYNKCQNTMWQS